MPNRVHPRFKRRALFSCKSQRQHVSEGRQRFRFEVVDVRSNGGGGFPEVRFRYGDDGRLGFQTDVMYRQELLTPQPCERTSSRDFSFGEVHGLNGGVNLAEQALQPNNNITRREHDDTLLPFTHRNLLPISFLQFAGDEEERKRRYHSAQRETRSNNWPSNCGAATPGLRAQHTTKYLQEYKSYDNNDSLCGVVDARARKQQQKKNQDGHPDGRPIPAAVLCC
jgi:hypothetical protein